MTPFIAQIQPFAFNFAPRGWQLCNGQLMPISSYSAVFSLVGTTFGGDGRTTFGIPDLRGRSMVGVGTGPGLETRTWGMRGGRNTVTLTASNLPSHTHTLRCANAAGTERIPVGATIAGHTGGAGFVTTNPDSNMNSQSITNTGSNIPFDIDNPFLGLYIGFAMEGIYPSRS
ncbi:phage tail protein [Roseivirga sp. E12]|uniref:phage tail protein n=1 Tax=Roseivirga sp. E12 TaxID=2819237 RepID=UPI001ABCF9A4|nr:tail fiber protein [Roseivirga sp. E12]MBO3699045.1 phage tail protein [Roseivirga sp. E12]